jgi:pyridoxal phosphate enzyme (YggS family)
MTIEDRYNEIRAQVPENVKIVAVSKTKPAPIIEQLYSKTGHKIYGENRVNELNEKQEILPKDITWHFIGHLQTNKVKIIAPFVGLIQSVDSFRLLQGINYEGIKNKRIVPCLLQFHIAVEESKYGFSIEEALRMLDDKLFIELTNISICGVMGMATFTNDEKRIRAEFKTLNNYFNILKTRYFSENLNFSEISMGMTGDYKLAIEEGSTIIRIGSGIFGS